MTTYTFRANFPSDCECSGRCDFTEVTASSKTKAEKLAREYFSRSIKLSIIDTQKDKSDPCPICKKPFKTCGHF